MFPLHKCVTSFYKCHSESWRSDIDFSVRQFALYDVSIFVPKNKRLEQINFKGLRHCLLSNSVKTTSHVHTYTSTIESFGKSSVNF